jgi:DNA-binding IclR family transcriptional regulator
MVKVGDNVRSLHATSAGKALLAGMDERAFEAAIKGVTLTPLTKLSITSKAALRADVEKGRERGWYLNQGESLEGVTTLSARFRWNAVTYIVTIAGPSSRIDDRLEHAASLLTNVCVLLEMKPGTAPAAGLSAPRPAPAAQPEFETMAEAEETSAAT